MSNPPEDDDLAKRGGKRRDIGAERAASGRDASILRTQITLIRAIVESPDGTATLDDGTPYEELVTKYGDGGKWRGAAVRQLLKEGLIEPVDKVMRSERPSAHRAKVGLWRATDVAVAKHWLDCCRKALAQSVDAKE